MPYDDLPVAEFAFPGPARDRHVAAVLAGTKTGTSALVAEYERSGERLPFPGQREAVVDSRGRCIAVIETVAARVVRLEDVDLAHAHSEGCASVRQWREEHERVWLSAAMRQVLDEAAFTLDDDTLVVAQEFRLVGRYAESPAELLFQW
ncbi:MAG TPA: ASCH domain-containing protein [Streptosporangiaceae bacterium]|nr:ASCH domain-containing protein [Streptosporangiaceae bacterium]